MPEQNDFRSQNKLFCIKTKRGCPLEITFNLINKRDLYLSNIDIFKENTKCKFILVCLTIENKFYPKALILILDIYFLM